MVRIEAKGAPDTFRQGRKRDAFPIQQYIEFTQTTDLGQTSEESALRRIVHEARNVAQGARIILVAGRPLREPVMRYGPFVMNTKQELIGPSSISRKAGSERESPAP